MKSAIILIMLANAIFSLTCPDINVQVFPRDNPMNWDVSGLAVHKNSDNYIKSVGADKHVHPDFGTGQSGIPYCLTSSTVATNKLWIEYADEADPGPYYMPVNAPIEGGSAGQSGDRHALAVDVEKMMIYEFFAVSSISSNKWVVGGAAIFDMRSNKLRKRGATSCDAAGLSVFAGLVRYGEVAKGVVPHAMRINVGKSQRKYFYPATHFAAFSNDKNLPPMGMRLRLKAGANTGGLGKQARVLAESAKKYGFIVADNGGDWFFNGAPDDRWDMADLATFKRLKGADLEVVQSTVGDSSPVLPVKGGDYADGWVGYKNPSMLEDVTIPAGPFNVGPGKMVIFKGVPMGKTSAEVFDESDKSVLKYSPSYGLVKWDFKDSKGVDFKPGKYKYKLSFTGKDKKVDVKTFDIEIVEKPAKSPESTENKKDK